MRILTVFTTLLLFHFAALAQKQDNVWCMGRGGGVDFNTNPPTGFQSKISAIETTASISDRYTGALLFYTDGGKIWDASHNIMQNGTGIGQDEDPYSSVQGAVIVPFIDDETKYYVFTLPAINPVAGQLLYSVVDMTLNNGLGGVVPGMKKINIGGGNRFNEGMIAMQGCGVVWLVVQLKDSGDFYVYRISDKGIDTSPVISQLNYPERPSSQAGFRASPDYTRIASLGKFFQDNYGQAFLALHDFDRSTGKITNGVVIDTGEKMIHYGCEFSPNGKLLYVTHGGAVYQYNLSLPTPAAIAASKTQVGQSTSFLLTNLQLRDDGSIYIVSYESGFLDRLSNCDALAPGCIFTGMVVETGGAATYNLPAKIVLPQKATPGIETKDNAAICNGAPVVLKPDNNNLTWQDGSNGDTYTVTQPGIYWARGYSADCKINTDTFVVDEVLVDAIIGNDTAICKGQIVMLQSNTQPAGATYLWSNGSKDDKLTVTEEGTYRLAVTYKGCTDADEAIISYHPAISIELGNDTIVCNDVKMLLPQKATTVATDKYLWQDGTTGNTLDATKAGTYFVTVAGKCGAVSDSVTITKRNCSLFFPSAFSPNGDGKNDILRMLGDVTAITEYTLNIYNRWGEQVFTTTNPLQGWNGMHGADLADIGTYFYYIQYKYKEETELMKGDIALVR